MKNKITAPEFDRYIRTMNKYSYSDSALPYIEILYKELDKIKSVGDDDKKELWFNLPRGSFSDYSGNKKDTKDKELERLWKYDYPDENQWYHMIAVRYKEYKTIIINNRIVLEMRPNIKNLDNNTYKDFFVILIEKIQQIIQMIKNETYFENIQANVPYDMRRGIIKAKDLWKYDQSKKDFFYDNLTQQEINYFLKIANKNNEKRIREMTSRQFFDACSVWYNVNNYKVENLNHKDQYLKFSDGRDEGLRDLDIDSSIDFEKWYKSSSQIIGHPWEIVRNWLTICTTLQPVLDNKGWYFFLHGENGYEIEAIKTFIELYKLNVPVVLHKADDLQKRITGDYLIGIVERTELPYACELKFPNLHVTQFANLPFKNREEIIKLVQWIDLIDLKLK